MVTPLDWRDPCHVAGLFAHWPAMAFLDSALIHDDLGRYAFVTADPFARFAIRDGIAEYDGRPLGGDPLDAMRQIMAPFAAPTIPDLPPFQGGAIGFFAYEFGMVLERHSFPDAEAPRFPHALFALYDWTIAFDRIAQKCWLICTGHGPQPAHQRRDAILSRLAEASRLAPRAPMRLDWRALSTQSDHEAAVARTIDYILAGDIFQANITRRYSASVPRDFDPFAYYCQLRATNPAPFAAYLDFGDITIASSSPERFIKVAKSHVETRPIKGTAHRAKDAREDGRRADALQHSIKDRAENVMIVDLLRNDLSRVCEAGTVDVPVLCGVESYASLHHLVSAVTGELSADHDRFDLIRAVFPGGSITGAPKIRAMQIIAELERHERGPYCGTIGYLGFDGTVDLNIAIRTVVFQGCEASFDVGGGITALSDPHAEYDETLLKAKRILAASDQR
ncbi:aminodeoxychorismate synthase component I [Methylovirgula sp. 4M-Z18]|nr:aminodeoxychorismate synthase component I [Methylovirgula sp. 4M-Z18]